MSFFKKDEKKKFITSNDYFICPKGGAPMDHNVRYCIKCGTLNYDHPDNQYMKKYVSGKEIDKIGRDYFDNNNLSTSSDDVYVGGKKLKEVSINNFSKVESKNYTAGLVYVLFLLLIVLGSNIFLLGRDFNTSLKFSLIVGLSLISILSICNIYRKAGYSGFTAFIPFYSNYVLCDMLFDNGILFLISFIPIVNIIFLLIMLYKLGNKFGINGVLTVIFSPIVILYISFSNRAVFLGNPADKDKNLLLSIIGFIFLIVYILIGYYLKFI